MEKFLEISNLNSQNLRDIFLVKSDDREDDTKFKFRENTDSVLEETGSFKTTAFKNTPEDSETFTKNLFGHRDVILNEKWDSTQTVQSKIIHFTESEVFVDCLIDIENRIFEHRSFPMGLFTHISNLKVEKPILIKTKQRPGSIRIDVYPGEGIVKMENFKINDLWDDLIGSGLDKKLTEW